MGRMEIDNRPRKEDPSQGSHTLLVSRSFEKPVPKGAVSCCYVCKRKTVLSVPLIGGAFKSPHCSCFSGPWASLQSCGQPYAPGFFRPPAPSSSASRDLHLPKTCFLALPCFLCLLLTHYKARPPSSIHFELLSQSLWVVTTYASLRCAASSIPDPSTQRMFAEIFSSAQTLKRMEEWWTASLDFSLVQRVASCLLRLRGRCTASSSPRSIHLQKVWRNSLLWANTETVSVPDLHHGS